MNTLLWIGLILLVLWAIGWLGFQMAGFFIHVLLIGGAILLIIWAVQWLSGRSSTP